MGIDETGVVIGVSNERAWIRIESEEDCSSCASSSCHREEGPNGRRVVEALNTMGVRTGQRVQLHTRSADIIKASLLMYVLPLFLLLTGAFWGRFIGKGYAEDLSDVLALTFGLGLMGAGFVGIRLYNNRTARRKEFYPRITRVIT